jgi:hypothetical protein
MNRINIENGEKHIAQMIHYGLYFIEEKGIVLENNFL